MSDSQNTELLRLVTQMVKEIGDFRAENRSEFVALRGEMAAVREEMAAFRTEVNERFDKIEANIIEVEWSMKHLVGDMLKIHGQLDRNEDRLRRLEVQAA